MLLAKERCWTGEEIKEKDFSPGWLYDEKEEYIQKSIFRVKSNRAKSYNNLL